MELILYFRECQQKDLQLIHCCWCQYLFLLPIPVARELFESGFCIILISRLQDNEIPGIENNSIPYHWPICECDYSCKMTTGYSVIKKDSIAYFTLQSL